MRQVCLILSLVVLTVSCGSDDTADPTTPTPTPIGVWRMTAGSILVDIDPYEPHFFVLNEDGTGHWTLRSLSTSALLRIDLVHSLSGNTLNVSFVGLGGGIGAEYEVVLDGTEVIRLVGKSSAPPGLVEGRIGIFSRTAQLPDEFRLQTLEVVNRIDGLESPSRINDLVTDGTVLIYQTPDVEFGAMQKIDPDNGNVLDTFTSFSGAQHIQATQDGGYWTHCGCGGSNDASLTGGMTSDQVDTTELGAEIQIRAMAFDPAARVLWLHGSDRLLQVNADAEPDVLLDSDTFDEPLAGMAWDGEQLWMIFDSNAESLVIVRVDATTLKVVETYRSPDLSVDWSGITFIGQRMFLLGEDAADAGVIVEISKPN